MLDPLKFEVAIKDRATKELEEIEKKLINKLNGKNALSDVMSRSFKVAKNEVERLQNELVRAQRVIETFGDKGFNVASLERYKMALLEVRNNLELIKKNGGLHPQTGLTASQFLTSEDTSRVVSLLKTELSYYQNIGKELERIAHLRSALTSTMQAYPSSPYRSELSQAIAGLDLREGLLARQGVRDATQTINSSAYRQQIQEAVTLISKVSAESRNSAKENAQMIESMRRAGIAVSDLAAKFDKLEIAKIRANAVAAKIDTSAYDKAVERMDRYKRVLDYIAQHGGHDAKRITGSVGYRNAANDLNIQATALKALTTEADRAARANQKLVAEEQRLAQALIQSTNAARSQSQVLSDLKSLATQYLGVWGVQGFLKNIIEIGGQLEQQRLSIGAILGDMSAGQHLFNQIKELAVISPFGVMELDRYTKQLSAYGFKQNELYDMTKRLADISAGAGTEVSRLALALGHVRSEGALSGYTLRQFAMNNIPMLQKLSDRLSEIEGRIVSTAEIRKRVSKKEIGYEDVISVIKDLTDEGGMFYNMQETMADSVNAKFKNLKDSMDIMYGEMAESGIGDLLKRIASSLMTVTRNWSSTLRIVGLGTAAFLLYKSAMAGVNKNLTVFGNTSNLVNLRLNAQRITLGLNSSSVKRLSAAEIDRMVTLKMLTREQLLNAVATKRLTVDQAELAAATFNVSRAELVALANGGKMGLMWKGLKVQAQSFLLTLGGIAKSLVNPFTIAFAAISAGFEIFMRWKQKNEEIKESIEQMAQKGSDGYKNISDTLAKYQKQTLSGGYDTAIGDIIDSLKNYAPNVSSIIEEAYAIDDLGKRYMFLRKELESTKNAYADLQNVSGVAINANEATGNLINDTFTENVEDYVKDLDKVKRAESDFYHHRASIDATLSKLASLPAFKQFSKERLNDDGSMKTTEEQMKIILANVDYYREFSRILTGINGGARAAFQTYYDALGKADERMKNEVLPDLKKFAENIDSEYTSKFGKDWKKNADHVKSAWMEILAVVDRVPQMNNKVRQDLFEEIFNKEWKLDIKVGFTTDEVEEQLPQWMQEIQKELDGTGIFFKADMDYEQIIDTVKSGHDKAQETVNKLKPIVLTAGIQFDGIQDLNIEQYRYVSPELYSVLQELQPAISTVNKTESFGKKRGLDFSRMKKDGSLRKNGSANKKDTVLEGWKEEWNELKAFYTEYKRWAEKIGDDKAIEKLRSTGLWGQFFNKDGSARYSMKDWGQAIDDFKKQLKGGTKDRDKFLFEVGKERLTPDFDQISKNLDEQLKAMEKYLSENAEKYDLYRYLLEQTGNESFASLAFGDYRMWDDASKKARKHLEKSWGSAISNWNMDESQAEKFFGGNKAMLKAYTEIQGNIRKKGADLLKEEAQALNKTLDIDGKIALKEAEIERIRKEGGNNDGRIKQAQEELKGLQTEKFQQAPEFLKFYDAVLTMSIDEAENMGLAIRKNLTEQLANSRISAKNFLTEIKKIDEQIKKVRSKKGDLFNLMTGGLDEMLQQRSNKAVDRYQSAAIDYENAQRDLEKAQRNNDSTGVMNALLRRRAAEEEMKTAKKVFNLSDTQLDNLNQAVKICKMIDDIVRGIGEGFENVRKAADSLGVDTDRNAWTSINGALGAINGVTSSISGIAQSVKNGDIGGVISNTVGMFTKPIVALSEAHDKRREHQIEQLREDVHKIDNTLNLIKSLRSRTLGYDNGDLRRSMANMYAQRSGASAKGMYEYYSRGGLRGTGYRQEIDALRKQREDYQKMYDAENDKKKKSSESLEEYKVKMAELDEQIQNYAEDLSKELWGIDFQSWADQLGDAIMTAFENGEDMARAFNDAVKSIMQDIVSEVLKIGIIEPMMERLRNKLFGDNGVVSTDEIVDDPVAASRKLVNALGEYFKPGGEGSNMVNAANDFLSGVNGMMKQMGFSNGLLGDDSSKSVSSGIKGIQEQTADLLASYINAIRQDVSVIRMQEDTLYKEFISNYWSSYISHVTGIEGSITSIQNNTAAIVRMMESGQGALYEKVNRIEDHLDSVIHGANKMNVK